MGSDAAQLADPPLVFELGAYNGYFCRRLADDFKANAIAVDGQPFLEPYISPSGGSVTVLHRLMSATDINALTVHHDVIIAMSVLHHHNDWEDLAKALIDAGRVVFIETANPDEHLSSDAKARAHAAHDYFANQTSATIIAQTLPMASHGRVTRPLWVIDNG
jgi:2-polyprenyl-3-methyl-5-hydroxy-6-metoxy-1,4-benzoquinol methylase